MSIGLIAADAQTAEKYLPLALRFAEVTSDEVVVLEPLGKRGETKSYRIATEKDPAATLVTEALRRALEHWRAGDDGPDQPNSSEAGDARSDQAAPDARPAARRVPEVTMVHVAGTRDVDAVVDQLASHRVRLLLIPAREALDQWSPGTSFERRVFDRAKCDTLCVQASQKPPREWCRLLVLTSSGTHAQAALFRAAELAEAMDGTVTALHVVPSVDELSGTVGAAALQRIAGRVPRYADRIRTRVVLADQLVDGLAEALKDPCDLVLVGESGRRRIRRLISANVRVSRKRDDELPAFGVVHAETPLGNRFWRWLERKLQDRVPQLDRERRLSLVDRIQSNSQWDIDFVALICLSTLIATFGLYKNSSAVVIGAMLVAPLMTPLVGIGLSVVQGNLKLFRQASRAVLSGFLLAYLIGLAFGAVWRLAVRDFGPNGEMLARGSPDPLDLAVAFASGLAGSYAMGRPHLVSALPGVAIAASLVPPVATAGLATSQGLFALAFGALLLFITNIVAIILATAVSLWAVGIRDTHEHGRRQAWSRRLAIGFSILAVLLVVFESRGDRSELHQQLRDEVAVQGGTLIQVYRSHARRPLELTVVVELPGGSPQQLAEKLAELARAQLGRDVRVRLEQRPVHTAWSSAPDSGP